MNIKIIKTEHEYEDTLAKIEQLMDAEPGSSEADLLEVLSILVEKYEEEHYPIEMPDPISAIKFRMEQQELKQKDLIPFIGSQSKVSDILNRKRELSKEMIRQLHQGLGIPYEVLIQKPGQEYEEKKFDVNDYPLTEMVKKGYFPGQTDVHRAKRDSERLLDSLFAVFKGSSHRLFYCRHGKQKVDENALIAWQAHVINLIQQEKLADYTVDRLNDDFFHELLNISVYESGVLLVKEHLNNVGIHFIIAEHLNKTYLDGASFITPWGAPVVGMTLRYDRLDNFWFTLFHELAHVKLHLSKDRHQAFFDSTIKEYDEACDPYEHEANEYTWQMMIPENDWQKFILPGIDILNEDDVITFARDLKINPAIVAGRIRYHQKDYSHFTNLIGHKKVRRQFTQLQAVL